MITDAHTHLTQDLLSTLVQQNIYVFAAAIQPENAKELQTWSKQNDHIIPTYGLHPWQAERYTVEEMLPFLEQCGIIGEIGMDSEWCDVPLQIQEKVFVQQMHVAQKLHKPVMLHTKGQEKRIAELIDGFSIPVIVHWYSCMEHLEAYIKRGCYFTVGPDIHINPAVRQVAKQVPLDHLMIETDGLGAVEWATGKKVAPKDLRNILTNIAKEIASIKNIETDQVILKANQTFFNFVNGKI